VLEQSRSLSFEAHVLSELIGSVDESPELPEAA